MSRLPRIVKVNESSLTASADSPRPVVSTGDQHSDTLVAWPLCPGCARERATMCPYCRTVGNEFPRADDAERDWHAESGGLPITARPTEADPEVSPTLHVVCPTCDEPFTPVFYDECAWCGHAFPDGRPTPARLRDTTMPARREWTPQGVMLAWILAGLLGAVFAYFGWISQR